MNKMDSKCVFQTCLEFGIANGFTLAPCSSCNNFEMHSRTTCMEILFEEDSGFWQVELKQNADGEKTGLRKSISTQEHLLNYLSQAKSLDIKSNNIASAVDMPSNDIASEIDITSTNIASAVDMPSQNIASEIDMPSQNIGTAVDMPSNNIAVDRHSAISAIFTQILPSVSSNFANTFANGIIAYHNAFKAQHDNQ